MDKVINRNSILVYEVNFVYVCIVGVEGDEMVGRGEFMCNSFYNGRNGRLGSIKNGVFFCECGFGVFQL